MKKIAKTLVISKENIKFSLLVNQKGKRTILVQPQKAFTLAETLITLSILGIIAAITVPTLIRNHVDNANRAKVKKAMSMYEKALNNMIIENDLRSTDAIRTFGTTDAQGNESTTCPQTNPYFKTVEGANCRFKTADGVWWDITDITNPIIILNSNLKDETIANLRDIADNDVATNKTVFAMIGRYEEDKGILRINDKAYEDGLGATTNATNIAYMDKLWAFVNNQTSGGNSGGSEGGGGTPVVSKTPYEKYLDGDYDDYSDCSSTVTTNCYVRNSYDGDILKDENGTPILFFFDGGDLEVDGVYSYERDGSGNVTKIIRHYDGNDTVMVEGIEGEGAFYFRENYIYKSCNYNITEGITKCVACFAQGSKITLADGSKKAIEDIDFNDELKVWDFDNGCSAVSKPLWIRQETLAKQYTILSFSNGKELRIITNHSIFNVDEGKFTYPIEGMRTVLQDGSIVTLEKKEIVEYPVKYYNVVTENHLNMYADDVLVSCRLNNMYPIKDMKFVKDNRELVPYEEFEGIPYEWYQKLRLAEQPRDINRDGKLYLGKDVREYVLQMMASNKRQMAVV